MVGRKTNPENQESIVNTEENAVRLMSYEEVKQENEALTKSLNNRIQSENYQLNLPQISIYDVFLRS